MDNIDKLPVTMEPAEQITGNMQYRGVESPLKLQQLLMEGFNMPRTGAKTQRTDEDGRTDGGRCIKSFTSIWNMEWPGCSVAS